MTAAAPTTRRAHDSSRADLGSPGAGLSPRRPSAAGTPATSGHESRTAANPATVGPSDRGGDLSLGLL